MTYDYKVWTFARFALALRTPRVVPLGMRQPLNLVHEGMRALPQPTVGQEGLVSKVGGNKSTHNIWKSSWKQIAETDTS
jgi:hypothetical protein